MAKLFEGIEPGELPPANRRAEDRHQFGWWVDGRASLHNARSVAALVLHSALASGMRYLEIGSEQLIVKHISEPLDPVDLASDTIGFKAWFYSPWAAATNAHEIPPPLSSAWNGFIDSLIGYPDKWPQE